jgi:hypothetical protein
VEIAEVSEEGWGAEEGGETEQRTRKRRPRRRRRRRSDDRSTRRPAASRSREAGETDLEADEIDLEAVEVDTEVDEVDVGGELELEPSVEAPKGDRTRRRQHPVQAEEPDDWDSTDDGLQARRDDEDDQDDEDDEDDEDGEDGEDGEEDIGRGARDRKSARRQIPPWSEAIDIIVSANLANRSRREPRRHSGRRRRDRDR